MKTAKNNIITLFLEQKSCGKKCEELVELLKHSVVLKFNNVEKLKTMWKLLKERPIEQGEQWRQRLTERANSLASGAGLIKMSRRSGEFKWRSYPRKSSLKFFEKNLTKARKYDRI